MKKNKEMGKKKSNLGKIIIAVGLAALVIPLFLLAQQAGFTRVALQRHDITIPGREVLQVRIDIEPGVSYPKHEHPGEEMVYVLKGVLEYRLGDAAPVVLKEGEVLFIPAGKVHSLKNIGTGKGSELATYIVEKGKPLLVLK